MSIPSYNITRESVTAVINGKIYTVKAGDKNFEKAKKAVLEERWDDLPPLVSKGLGVERWAKGAFSFRDNAILFKGEEIDPRLNKRIISMSENGEDPSFLMKFWENLQKNPSWRSVQQLYPFLENEGIAIDQDGMILSYKAVKPDYTDYHTGTFDNHPGKMNEMPRNKVSDEYEVACHTGFHTGSLSYAMNFGDSSRRVIITRTHPADVVCVSKDGGAHKIRVCKYHVVGNHGEKLPDTSFNTKKDLDQEEDISLGSGWDNLKKEGASDSDSEVVVHKPVWAGFDDLSDDEISQKNIEVLRKYAGQKLRIVNSGKMKKADLLKKIFEVRGA